MAGLDQAGGDRAADKTGRTGDEYFHALPCSFGKQQYGDVARAQTAINAQS
jgi:hypothetical protein